MAITYAEYLKLDELLKLQQPLSDGENDETLFIVIHQVYELWFKQMLHETTYLQSRFQVNDAPQILATFKRILTILKTMVSQIDILETMTPLSFLSFRTRLESSSGFQSVQFRQFEIALGKRTKASLAHHPEGSDARKKLEAEFKKPSLFDSFLHFLKTNGYAVPPALLTRDLSESTTESPELQAILLNIYRTNPMIAQICERFVDLDEGIQEWRYRHVKMVERTIGMRMGTGGSSGAEYLRATLMKPLFADLWTIRVQF